MKRIQQWALVLGAVLVFGGVCHGQAVTTQGAERTLTGTVYGPSGAPAPGVAMLVAGSLYGPQRPIKTDDNGKYAINWRPMGTTGTATSLRVYALVARDLEQNLTAMHTVDETTTNLDLHLQPGLAISTTLQDTGGKPVSNGTTRVMLYVTTLEAAPFVLPIPADGQGRVQIPALPQGGHYILSFNAPGYGSVRQITITEDESRTSRLVLPAVVFKPANLKLAGQVFRADGQPASGAWVSIIGTGQPGTNTPTDATGHFTVNVCGGPVNVNASEQGATGRGLAVGGDTNVVIRLGSGNPISISAISNNGGVAAGMVTITGTVFDPSGAPAAGVAISGFGPGANINQDVTSDAAGKFNYSWRPPNLAQMGNPIHLLMGRDLEHNFAATANMDEATTNLDLHLQQGLVLAGTVRESTGAAVTAATARLSMTHRSLNSSMTTTINRQPALVDEKGAFTFSGLPQGEGYSVNVTAPGFGIVSMPIQEIQTHAASFQLPAITLKPADRPLEGTVLGPDGAVAPRATVSVSGQGQPTTSMAADANGHFAFKVCEGAVLVRASSQVVIGQRVTGSVQTQGGDVNVILRLPAPGAARGGIQPAQTNGPPPLGPWL